MTEETPPDVWQQGPSDSNPWRQFIIQLKLVWRLLTDRRVPFYLKGIPFLSAIYLFVPTDIVPDILIGLGQLDDLAVVALGIKLFLELAPPALVSEHLDALMAAEYAWDVIEGEAESTDD